jgi:cob(I)alamin adenosyltransferase
MSIYINKIYTRSGDDGTTGLVSGQRISKAALRVDCYGTSDELLSVIGILRTYLESSSSPELKSTSGTDFKKIQNELFDLGSLLACPDSQGLGSMPNMTEEQVLWLETRIDQMTEHLPALKSFVLPGGSMINAFAHQARTVCRRLERLMVLLREDEKVASQMLKYVNRLSDYLFAFSRHASRLENIPEYLWDRPLSEK